MAFKSVKEYNEARFGNMFLLRNDKDYGDVILLYRGVDDVLVADTHYIKSSDYSGYVHCCGVGCPACAKGIRVQTKLFIPLYNIQEDEIQFFDRNIRFENQLNHEVLSKFPNPSEYVFRITRNGVAGSVDTTYSITAVGKNTVKSYDEIMAQFNTRFPDYFDRIVKEVPEYQLSTMLNAVNTPDAEGSLPSYSVKPREAFSTTSDSVEPVIPESMEPTEIPPFDEVVSDDPEVTPVELDDDDVDF